MKHAQEVIEYWFENVDDQTLINKKVSPFCKWFSGRKDLDFDIREKFETDIIAVHRGQNADWLETAQGCLAVVLLQDQFTRNIYRDTSKMFMGDAMALEVSLKAINENLDKQLLCVERIFLYMPLMHAEDMKMQELSVQCFEGLVCEAQNGNLRNVNYYQGHLNYARKYYEIIKIHERFLHRDNILRPLNGVENV